MTLRIAKLISWAALAVCAAVPAQAHVIAPQYSVFDNGALHAIANLQLFVPLLALGIALGRHTRSASAVLGCLWLGAFGIGSLVWNWPGNPLAGFGTPLAFVSVGCALMLGGGRLGLAFSTVAALVVGVFIGGIGRQEDPVAGMLPGWFTLGICIGAALIVFFAAEAAASYRRDWLTIPVRIAASWMLAIGLMFFGLALKPPAANPPAAASTASAPLNPDGTPDLSSCPGPHKHGLDGEIICLPVPTIDKAGTPSSIAKYGDAPPPVDAPAPAGPLHANGGAAP